MEENKDKLNLDFMPSFMTALDAASTLIDLKNIELKLPMLKTSVKVSPITTLEDLTIKSYQGSSQQYLKEVDKLIYKHTEFIDEKMKPLDFEEFLERLAPEDKQTLLYGVLRVSFPVLDKRSMKCKHCEEEIIFETKLDEMLQSDSFKEEWDKQEEVYRWRKTIEVIKDKLTIKIKYLMEADILRLYNDKGNSAIAKLLESTGKPYSQTELTAASISFLSINDGTKDIVLDTPDDIYNFYTKAPIQLQKQITNALNDVEVGEYNPVFYTNIHCPACNESEKNRFEIDDISKELLFQIYQIL